MQEATKVASKLPVTAFVARRAFLSVARRLLVPSEEGDNESYDAKQHVAYLSREVGDAVVGQLTSLLDSASSSKDDLQAALDTLALTAYLAEAGADEFVAHVVGRGVVGLLRKAVDASAPAGVRVLGFRALRHLLPRVEPGAVGSRLLHDLVTYVARPLLGREVATVDARRREQSLLVRDAEMRVDAAKSGKDPRWKILRNKRSSRHVPRIAGAACAIMGGHLYVYGGVRPDTEPLVPFESLYSVQLDRKGVHGSWKHVTVHMPTADLQLNPTKDHALLAYNHKLYLFGGCPAIANEPVNLLWTFMEISFQRKGGIVANAIDVNDLGARPQVRSASVV